jgi:hypothetical protein
MAFDRNGTRFLLYARHLGVDFSRMAVIGRQRLQVGVRELAGNLRLFDKRAGSDLASSLIRSGDGYSEEFLRHLGATDIHSFDCTAYEGATDVHDMNLPVAEVHRERYSLVLNGGSLEHVFNFPVAVRNCMEMVAVGGHFLTLGPANNWMGHGFYQFSPELFFRLLNGTNGYRMVRLVACEDGPRARWFVVRDPEAIRKRVGVISRTRVSLLVLAQRIERRPILETMPQQSDYTAAWARSESQVAGATSARQPSWRRQVRRRLKRGLKRVLSYGYGSFDPRLFERLDLARELAVPNLPLPSGRKR